MKKTPLKRKTKLQTKTGLKAKTPLKANTGLKNRSSLKSNADFKSNTPLKVKQKTARKLKTPYRSIFSEDLDICVITGSNIDVVPHHIFSGGRKSLSEKYGFILPLRKDWHEGTNYSIHQDRTLELKYKVMCEEYYINILGKSKEEWIEEFGKWWELKVS